MPPTIVFVPGAYHSPFCYTIVAHKLQQAGYPTHLVTLPSVGPDEYLKDMNPDVTAIRSALTTLIAAGTTNIILIMHSYGGIPGSAAVSGLEPHISHLIYISAFLLPVGTSLYTAIGSTDQPWWHLSPDRTHSLPTAAEAIAKFYNDLPADEAAAAATTIKPQSHACFEAEAKFAAWAAVPTTFVVCEQDQAIPVEVQRAMVEEAKAASGGKVRFEVESVDAGHSPFLSRPDEVVAVIRRAAGEV